MGLVRGWKPVKPTASTGFMERAMGIEPMSEAWETLPQIMRLHHELAQICKAGLELACLGRCGPPI